jgi:predicted unusual protein kinase regulating ubiquinone biosynthesis (AarF/ABC1/UbiB family)
MCTGLDPSFNLFAALTPFAQRLMEQELGEQGFDHWLNEVTDLGRRVLSVPGRLDRVLERLERSATLDAGRLARPAAGPEPLASAINRLAGGVMFAGVVVASALLYLNGQAGLAACGGGLAGVLLLWTLWPK